MHTYIHTYINTYIHACTHAHPHTHIYIYVWVRYIAFLRISEAIVRTAAVYTVLYVGICTYERSLDAGR